MFSFLKRKSTSNPVVIVPRIKTKGFVEAVSKVPGIKADTMPVVEPIAGDLLLTYAVDVGDGYEMVSPASIAKYNLKGKDLRALALVNALPALSKATTRTDGTVHELSADDNMAACCVLFRPLWDQIEQQLGGKVLAAFPHRDAVLFARADKPGAVEALKRTIGQIDSRGTHALSQLLYQRVDGNWQVLEAA